MVISNSYFEVNTESDWGAGYKDGQKSGFDSGVICAYAVIRSGKEFTNIMELIIHSRSYASNAVVNWKKNNP